MNRDSPYHSGCCDRRCRSEACWQRGGLIKLDLTSTMHVAATTPKPKVSKAEAAAARQRRARRRRRILVRRIDAFVAAHNAKSHPLHLSCHRRR